MANLKFIFYSTLQLWHLRAVPLVYARGMQDLDETNQGPGNEGRRLRGGKGRLSTCLHEALVAFC